MPQLYEPVGRHFAPPSLLVLPSVECDPQPQGDTGRELHRFAINCVESFLARRQHGLAVVIDQLRDLFATEEDRPSAYAFSTAGDLLIGANPHLFGNFPKAHASSDGEGGVRIEWAKADREIRLVIPAHEDGRKYLYYQAGRTHGIHEPVTHRSLAHWLDRLLGES